jgi:hypothetical protein
LALQGLPSWSRNIGQDLEPRMRISSYCRRVSPGVVRVIQRQSKGWDQNRGGGQVGHDVLVEGRFLLAMLPISVLHTREVGWHAGWFEMLGVVNLSMCLSIA